MGKRKRKQRRAIAKMRPGYVVFIDSGTLLEGDPNYGLPVNCYVCGAPHKALGVARIQDKQTDVYVPLCEPCRADAELHNTISRKYLNAPDLKITEGGEATTEQVLAVAEKQDATEH